MHRVDFVDANQLVELVVADGATLGSIAWAVEPHTKRTEDQLRLLVLLQLESSVADERCQSCYVEGWPA